MATRLPQDAQHAARGGCLFLPRSRGPSRMQRLNTHVGRSLVQRAFRVTGRQASWQPLGRHPASCCGQKGPWLVTDAARGQSALSLSPTRLIWNLWLSRPASRSERTQNGTASFYSADREVGAREWGWVGPPVGELTCVSHRKMLTLHCWWNIRGQSNLLLFLELGNTRDHQVSKDKRLCGRAWHLASWPWGSCPGRSCAGSCIPSSQQPLCAWGDVNKGSRWADSGFKGVLKPCVVSAPPSWVQGSLRVMSLDWSHYEKLAWDPAGRARPQPRLLLSFHPSFSLSLSLCLSSSLWNGQGPGQAASLWLSAGSPWPWWGSIGGPAPPPHTGPSPGVPGSLEQAVGSSGAAEGALPHRSGVDTQLTWSISLPLIYLFTGRWREGINFGT